MQGATNVTLALALKYDLQLKILVTGGYYDLATPHYEGWFEMHHLPIPESLHKNIEYKYFPSGHMVFAHQESLKGLMTPWWTYRADQKPAEVMSPQVFAGRQRAIRRRSIGRNGSIRNSSNANP